MENLSCSVFNCRNEAVGTFTRYGDAPYCYLHLITLASMNSKRRPKPTIEYFEGLKFVPPEIPVTVTPKERILRISEFEQAEKILADRKTVNTPPSVVETQNSPKPLPIERSKTGLKWIAGVAIFASIVGLVTWNESVQTHKEAVRELQARNVLASRCFRIEDENRAAQAGSVGSAAREEAVIAFYENVISSECVEWGDGSIFSNPFYKAKQNSWNWQNLQNAFTYTLQRWNGVEPFSLHCADGWQSPSIGRKGACSHHGGVTSGFNEFRDWDLMNHIGLGQAIYPALATLENAAKN